MEEEEDIRDLFYEYERDNRIEMEMEEKKIKYDNMCENCEEINCLVNDETIGIVICNACGIIVEQMFDNAPEWGSYDNKDDTSRCGIISNHIMPNTANGTTIGAKWNKLRSLDNWDKMTYKERSLQTVFSFMQGICEKAGILKCIIDDAKIMYRLVSECTHKSGKNIGKLIIVRGINRKGIIAACVFFSCKNKEMTRSPKEISILFGLKCKDMTKGCKTLIKMFRNANNNLENKESYPEHFINRFCVDLNLGKENIDFATKIASNIRKLNLLTDHTPVSIAIVSILMTANNKDLSNITKKKLSQKFKISEITITKTIDKIEKYEPILINDIHTNNVLELFKVYNKEKEIPIETVKRFKMFNVELPNNNKNYDVTQYMLRKIKIILMKKQMEEDRIRIQLKIKNILGG